MRILIRSFLLFGLLVVMAMAGNQKTEDLEAFVRRGGALISEQGEAAFPAFRQKGGEWFEGDRYLFVWDLQGVRYVYPPDTRGEGEQVHDLKDIDGKPIGERIIAAAASGKGYGWVHYRWPKPGQTKPEWKSTYVMKATAPSGKTYLIGSGAYDMPVQRSFVIQAVDDAVALIEHKGVRAFDTLRDTRSEYIYQDTYVFIIDENGVELLNAAFPKLEGRDVSRYRDAEGNYFVRELIRVAREKGAGWVDYPWPKPGDVKQSHKSTYVRKAVMDGKMVVVGAGLYLD